MLGVRFVLSDTAIDIADFTQVERLEGPQAELLLYRLEGANLANWSPVDVRVVKDNSALLDSLNRDAASLQTRVFLSSDPPRALNDLVLMRRGSLSFEQNAFRFQGESPGWSLALLPLQFLALLVANGREPKFGCALTSGKLFTDRAVVQRNGRRQIQV
jgi:hypothetical protein